MSRRSDQRGLLKTGVHDSNWLTQTGGEIKPKPASVDGMAHAEKDFGGHR
jgi:hypothetical protein